MAGALTSSQDIDKLNRQTFYIDKVFVKIKGKQRCLWRAVDQDGEDVNVYLQAKRGWCGCEAILQALIAELWWRTWEDRHGKTSQLSRRPSRGDA